MSRNAWYMCIYCCFLLSNYIGGLIGLYYWTEWSTWNILAEGTELAKGYLIWHLVLSWGSLLSWCLVPCILFCNDTVALTTLYNIVTHFYVVFFGPFLFIWCVFGFTEDVLAVALCRRRSECTELELWGIAVLWMSLATFSVLISAVFIDVLLKWLYRRSDDYIMLTHSLS